ncbi:hypothetical protein EJ110_NYTH46054 [Nymphaea thermarum]|nr:hypothetical protein EJ110_NYTH46054 [Nymphaea thermarum]
MWAFPRWSRLVLTSGNSEEDDGATTSGGEGGVIRGEGRGDTDRRRGIGSWTPSYIDYRARRDDKRLLAKMSGRYPHPYTSTALVNLIAAIQCTCIAAITERNINLFTAHYVVCHLSSVLSFIIRSFTYIFCLILWMGLQGVVVSRMVMLLTLWGIQKRGPLFVSMFNPLCVISVALFGSLMLEEPLYLGSVIGAGFIILGLYTVQWGKGKEVKELVQLQAHRSAGEATNLGILVSGLVLALISWAIQMRGPLFVSAFNPLSLVIVAFLGSIFLDEALHLGRNTLQCGWCWIDHLGTVHCAVGQRKEVKELVQLQAHRSAGEATKPLSPGCGRNGLAPKST